MKDITRLIFAVALALLVATHANASQHSRSEEHCLTQHCLTQADANQISSRFAAILNKTDSDIGNYTQTAEAVIGEHYYAVSDSILSLNNLTVRSSLQLSRNKTDVQCNLVEQPTRQRRQAALHLHNGGDRLLRSRTRCVCYRLAKQKLSRPFTTSSLVNSKLIILSRQFERGIPCRL